MTDRDVKKVALERELAFPPSRVWRALTEPHLMAEWLMKTDFAPALGHAFRFESEAVTVACEVREIEPERRLVYSWDAFGLESTVTWTLEPTAAGTRLTLEQEGFRADQKRELGGARSGWTHFLNRLEALLSAAGDT